MRLVISKLLMTLFGLLSAATAFGFYSTLDTGEILEVGTYKAQVETQFLTSGDDGINLNLKVDGGINEESNWRGALGFGTTDFHIGGFYKWIPYPDIESQPAIGVIGGVQYASYDEISEISVRIHPLLSKKFDSKIGPWTPFATVPIGFASRDGEMEVPVQVAVGTEFQHIELEKFTFFTELGFNVRKSFSYFSLAVTMGFDEENGFQF